MQQVRCGTDVLYGLHSNQQDKMGDSAPQTRSRGPPHMSSLHALLDNVDTRKTTDNTVQRDYSNGARHQTLQQQGQTADQAIDPELIKREPSTEPGYAEALKAWARFRFVRAGWFTAQEAIDYID